MPYTYLIGWPKQNKFYYGVRWAYGCTPNDLWNTYFTSSKYVRQFVAIHGDPDIIQIRRVFDAKEKAIKWESKVLTRLNLRKNTKFLNMTTNRAIYNSPKSLAKMVHTRKNNGNPWHSIKTKEKLRGFNQMRHDKCHNNFKAFCSVGVYLIEYPDGTEEKITNLTKFCENTNLDHKTLSRLANGTYPHKTYKGYKIKKLYNTIKNR